MQVQVRAFIEQGLRREETLLDFIEAREKEPAPMSTGRVWHALTTHRWIHIVEPSMKNITSVMLSNARAHNGLMSSRIGEVGWSRRDMFTVTKSFAQAATAAAGKVPSGFQFEPESAVYHVVDITPDHSTIEGRLAFLAARTGASSEFVCGGCGCWLGYCRADTPRPPSATCPGCHRTLTS
ncbi:hypothetical protein ACIA8E_37105 [Streptomyces sp. NPDC051664]|uniref:hypothetical protein n=1 Tax=Streptomyces sp. NPDC051664 TaxID=3365668 RepID=UPI0037BCB91E